MTIKHFDQRQLAERWGISPKTLERWRWLGQGPKFLKLGGRIAYRLEDIEAFEKQQLRQVTGSAAAASPTPAVPQQARWPERPPTASRPLRPRIAAKLARRRLLDDLPLRTLP